MNLKDRLVYRYGYRYGLVVVLAIASLACPLILAQTSGKIPVAKKPVYKLNGPLQGSVQVDVPRTPEDVARYLHRMKGIISEYGKVAVGSLLPGGAVPGAQVDPGGIESAKVETVNVIGRIRSIVPPQELKSEHGQLASTLAQVSNFIEDSGDNQGGMAGLTQAGPMLSELHSTLDQYHRGVKEVIAYYGLSPDMDPFAGESEETKSILSGSIDSMKTRMQSEEQSADSSSGLGFTSSGAGLDGNGVLSLPGGFAGLGSQSGTHPDLGNMDINTLKQGLNGIDPKALGELLKQLQGL